jgi:phage gp29-like protein
MVKLFDAWGREIQARDAKRPETREVATVSLRDRWATYPSHGLTPERLANIFKSADAGDVSRQAELFAEMEEKDAHLASQFSIRKLAIQGLAYDLQPGAEDARAAAAAEFCGQVLGKLDFEDLVLDLLDAVAKGYSLAEIMWDVSAGQASVSKVNWIDARKVTFWNSITPRVLTDAAPAAGEDLAPFKFVYHRYKARSGMETRAGVLRTCAWMYLFKNYSVKDWVAFSEIYGQPLRVGKYDPSAGKAEKEALLAAVHAVGTDAAGIISRNTEIEFIEAQKYGSLNVYETLARFCDEQVSKAILGQTLTSEASGAGGTGSLALGKVHSDVRRDLLQADALALAKAIQRDLLTPLVLFNFGPDTPVPAFAFSIEEPEDLKSVAETIEVAGRLIDVSQEWVAERLKMPLRKPNETPLKSAAPAAPGPLALKATIAKAEGPAPAGTPAPEAPHPADILTGRLASASEEHLTAWLAPVRELLERAGSLDEFRDGLVDLFAGLDPAGLANAMAQALSVAELAGRFDADG